MAHTHDVYDMENHFEINGSSRFIKETSETKLVVVQGDHKSEVLTFKMPRYIDGHDMTLCNKIRIHYINLDTKTNNKSADVYEVTDLTLCEECEDVLTFTWTIEAPATKYSGTLSFLVKFECTEGENVLYQWNTAKYVSVNVLAGIDNSEEFVEKYSNVLEEWYNELTKGADSIEELNQQAIAEIELAKEDAKEDIQGKADATMAEMNKHSADTYNTFKNNVDGKMASMTQHANETFENFNNDVDEKAAETLASIPEDYAKIDADVKDKVDKKGKDQVTKYNSEFYFKTANIRDKARQIYGKMINTNDGTEINSDSMLISDFFEVGNNTNIGLTDFSGQATYVRFFFYDENKGFVSQKEVNSSNGVADIPEGAFFVRYSTYISYDERKFTITMPYTNKYIEPYVFEEMSKIEEELLDLKNGNFADASVSPEKTTFFDIIENLIDSSKVSAGAIFGDSGIFDSSFSTWTSTDYIAVKAGVQYYYSDNGVSIDSFTGALYSTDKLYLSSINNTNGFIPEQDGYCRISNGSWSDTRQLQVNEITDFVPYNEPIKTIKEEYLPKIEEEPEPEEVKNYHNKKVLILGDSITHADTGTHGWVKYFMEIIKPSVKVNVAIDGATWKDKESGQVYDGNPQPSTTGNCIGNQVQKIINEKANGTSEYQEFDVIIIAAGTNDSFTINPDTETIEDVESQFISGYGMQGTFEVVPLESVNRQTFSGIMRYSYQKLNELYPNAEFVICSPIQEVYENFESTYKKGELFRYIASRLSVHFFNTRDCGICNIYESPTESMDYDNPPNTESTVKRDLSDGIHTNESGARKLGRYIAKEFIKLFLPD